MSTMPAGEPSIPDLLKEIEGLKRAIRELQRPDSPEPTIRPAKDIAVFSYSGQAYIETGPA